MFINELFDNPEIFCAKALMVIFSICCHEFSHAWMALKQGDPTAADEGHLTLNPFKQMGFMSLLLLALVGIAWGQVPVNQQRMRRRYGPALTAFAGPGMNLILFLAFCLLVAVCHLRHVQAEALGLLLFGAVLNMALFLLNMLPIPTLDGWAILKCAFPNIQFEQSEFMKGMAVLAFIMVFMFAKYLFWAGVILAQLVIALCEIPLKLAGWF